MRKQLFQAIHKNDELRMRDGKHNEVVLYSGIKWIVDHCKPRTITLDLDTLNQGVVNTHAPESDSQTFSKDDRFTVAYIDYIFLEGSPQDKYRGRVRINALGAQETSGFRCDEFGHRIVY